MGWSSTFGYTGAVTWLTVNHSSLWEHNFVCSECGLSHFSFLFIVYGDFNSWVRVTFNDDSTGHMHVSLKFFGIVFIYRLWGAFDLGCTNIRWRGVLNQHQNSAFLIFISCAFSDRWFFKKYFQYLQTLLPV